MTVERFLAVEEYAQTGYLTTGTLRPDDQTIPMRWTWKGDGAGAGTLTVLGTAHYIANIRSALQSNPILRYCTAACGVDAGELDIGIIT